MRREEVRKRCIKKPAALELGAILGMRQGESDETVWDSRAKSMALANTVVPFISTKDCSGHCRRRSQSESTLRRLRPRCLALVYLENLRRWRPAQLTSSQATVMPRRMTEKATPLSKPLSVTDTIAGAESSCYVYSSHDSSSLCRALYH